MKNTITIGIDLGDKFHIAVVFDGEGNELETAQVTNTKTGVSKFFQRYKHAKVAMEAGTHSPWISRLLDEMGLTVYVGNPRKLRCIWDSVDKSDARDARILGMVCRIEPRLLHPLRHRSSQAQADLASITALCFVLTLEDPALLCQKPSSGAFFGADPPTGSIWRYR